MPEILLAFDFGMRKIGVAIGQHITKTATPLPLLFAKDGIPAWEKLDQLINSWHVDGLVVGIPYNKDGSLQAITHATKKFIRRLKNRYSLPVFEVDERWTTKEARMLQQETGKDAPPLDSIAAQLILESWFREHPPT